MSHNNYGNLTPFKPKVRTARKVEPQKYDIKQTHRWVDYVQRDYWWRSQMPIASKSLDAFCGGDCMRHKKRYPATMRKIASIIDDIENRKLCFGRRAPGSGGKGNQPHFLWVDPPGICPLIPKISKNWSLWARCATCGDNKFMPILIDEKTHVACYNCFPPSQYKSIGAVEEKKSLIHEALKIFI